MGYWYDWFKEQWRALFRVQCPDCNGYGFKIEHLTYHSMLVPCKLCRGQGRV